LEPIVDSIGSRVVIAVLDAHWRRYLELLCALEIDAVGSAEPDELVNRHSRQTQVLLGSPDLIAVAARRLPALRWVQSSWAGVEPLIALGPIPGVTVTRAVDVFGTQMREYVFGHLLGHAVRLVDRTDSSSWDPQTPEMLAGSRLGIMGTGSIGRTLAATARHFGISVVGLSRSGQAAPPFDRVFPTRAAIDFAAGLDHLVAVLPATAHTRHLVSSQLLARLTRGATFINVGRGSTVDLTALLSALASGRVSHAVLDVLDQEPIEENDPLWRVNNLVITSHTAAWSRPEDIVTLFADNLARWHQGTELRGTVDFGLGY